MEISYDDGYGFSGRSVISKAITAAELADLLHAPDIDDLDSWSDDVVLPADFEDFDVELAV